MKKIVSTIACLAMGNNMLMAGGDFLEPMEPVINIPAKEIIVIEDDVKYDGFYAGTALNHMQVSEARTVNGYGVTLVGGYYFNQFIGVEARYMRTLLDLDIDSSRPIVTTNDVLENVGLYIKPMYSITTGLALYGLAGYGLSTYNTKSRDYSESGLQWGLGAKYELANGLGLFVDYLDIYNDNNFDGLRVSDVQFNATSVGATYTF